METFKDSSWEFKILDGTYTDIQKWLNQWKHEFELKIIQVQFWRLEEGPDQINRDRVSIALARRKK